MDLKQDLKSLLTDNKFIMGFFLGILLAAIAIFFTFYLIGGLFAIIIVYFLFRKEISERMKAKTGFIDKARNTRKPCSECGSIARHRKGCSKSKEAQK